MNPVKLILASASPRRKILLEQIGLNFDIYPSSVPEPPIDDQPPHEYAESLARLKAADVATQFPDALILGADTIVVVDDTVLGKPVDAQDAEAMLSLLSGRTHQVITAYSFQLKTAAINITTHVLTRVHFKHLSNGDIQKYIKSGEPFDKAGAYGIQDYSGVFVDRIDGCFYNVVGLPISDLNASLEKILSAHQLQLL